MIQKNISQQDINLARQFGITNLTSLNPVILDFDAGEYICHEDSQISYLLFVREGRAKVFCNLENGKRLLVCFYESGSVIGDLEFLLDQSLATSSVQAITPLSCLAIPLNQNQFILSHNINFLRKLGKDMARKCDRSTKNSAHIILYPLEVRLCSYIDTGSKNDIFQEKLTEVAEVLGTSYRHLIRALNALIDEGILEKRAHSYYIMNRAELRLRSKDFYKPIEGSNPS